MDAQIQTGGPTERAWRTGQFVLLLAVAACWLALSALNIWMGELNQDEGWYLNAARLMTQGCSPPGWRCAPGRAPRSGCPAGCASS